MSAIYGLMVLAGGFVGLVLGHFLRKTNEEDENRGDIQARRLYRSLFLAVYLFGALVSGVAGVLFRSLQQGPSVAANILFYAGGFFGIVLGYSAGIVCKDYRSWDAENREKARRHLLLLALLVVVLTTLSWYSWDFWAVRRIGAVTLIAGLVGLWVPYQRLRRGYSTFLGLYREPLVANTLAVISLGYGLGSAFLPRWLVDNTASFLFILGAVPGVLLGMLGYFFPGREPLTLRRVAYITHEIYRYQRIEDAHDVPVQDRLTEDEHAVYWLCHYDKAGYSRLTEEQRKWETSARDKMARLDELESKRAAGAFRRSPQAGKQPAQAGAVEQGVKKG